jgi:hypothetical protein
MSMLVLWFVYLCVCCFLLEAHTHLPDCPLRDNTGASPHECNPTCYLSATVVDDDWWNAGGTPRPILEPTSHPVAPPSVYCDACGPDAFPVSLNDTQCNGLAKQGDAAQADADSCRASCCSDKQCNVWQFCPGTNPDDTCNGPSCWTGSGVALSACSTTSNLHKGWISQGANTPKCE